MASSALAPDCWLLVAGFTVSVEISVAKIKIIYRVYHSCLYRMMRDTSYDIRIDFGYPFKFYATPHNIV